VDRERLRTVVENQKEMSPSTPIEFAKAVRRRGQSLLEFTSLEFVKMENGKKKYIGDSPSYLLAIICPFDVSVACDILVKGRV